VRESLSWHVFADEDKSLTPSTINCKRKPAKRSETMEESVTVFQARGARRESSLLPSRRGKSAMVMVNVATPLTLENLKK
jgi:hypothetical protein